MSFLAKAARLVDSRVFSDKGLSDVWVTNGFNVNAILSEQEVDDAGVYVTELVLDIQASDRNKFSKGAVIYREHDLVSYKVIRIGKPIDNNVEILLGDVNA